MDKEVIFNDESLAAAYNTCAGDIKNLKNSLDKMSSDIKTIEKVLNEIALSDFEINDLVFDNGRLRVVSLQLRPLIECPVETRRRLYPLLPQFLKEALERSV